MLKTLSSLFLLFSILSAKAQTADTLKIKANDTTVYLSAEHPPEFPGGINEFYKYLGKSIRYPQGAYLNGIQGKVILQLIIEKDGSFSHIVVIRSASHLLDEEAIRVVKASPRWLPAMNNGQAVRMSYALPILFQVVTATHQ